MRGGSEKGIERETSSKAKKNVEGIERERKKEGGRQEREDGGQEDGIERKRERERKKKER